MYKIRVKYSKEANLFFIKDMYNSNTKIITISLNKIKRHLPSHIKNKIFKANYGIPFKEGISTITMDDKTLRDLKKTYEYTYAFRDYSKDIVLTYHCTFTKEQPLNKSISKLLALYYYSCELYYS